MEFYQLEYFRILCMCGSYTKAAQELMITQPAISTAIKKLEEEFGGKLIDRKSKIFALTQMGKTLLKRAELVHNEMMNIRMEMNAITRKQQETIRMALPPTMCPGLLAKLASGFASQHKDVSLRLSKKRQEVIAQELTNRKVDIGVICKDLLSPLLSAKDYKKVEFLACFSPEHKFNQYDCVAPQMLKDETLILSKNTNGISKCIQRYFEPYNIELHPLLYCEGDIFPEDARQLARRGMGIAFVAKHLCKDNCKPLSPPLYVDLVVAWHKGNTRTREIIEYKKELIDLIIGEENFVN